MSVSHGLRPKRAKSSPIRPVWMSHRSIGLNASALAQDRRSVGVRRVLEGCVCGGGNASSASDAVSTRRAQTHALTKVGVIDVSRAAALGVVLCSDTMTIIAAARIKRKRGAGDCAPLCLGCGRLVRVRIDLSTLRRFYEWVERTAAFGG